MEHESGSHISLHESVVEDMERKIGNEKKNIQKAKAAYTRMLNDLNFYKFQIENAKKENIDFFDNEKYKIDSRKKFKKK
jgi:hypothetical protein